MKKHITTLLAFLVTIFVSSTYCTLQAEEPYVNLDKVKNISYDEPSNIVEDNFIYENIVNVNILYYVSYDEVQVIAKFIDPSSYDEGIAENAIIWALYKWMREEDHRYYRATIIHNSRRTFTSRIDEDGNQYCSLEIRLKLS